MSVYIGEKQTIVSFLSTNVNVVLLLLSLSSGVRLAKVTVILFSSFISSSRFSLTLVFNSFYILLLFPILLPLFPYLFQCKHSIALSLFVFPPLSMHQLSGYLASPILSTCPAHFRRLLTSFFVQLSLIEPPFSVRSFFSYPIASLPRFLLSSFIFKPVLSSAVLC